MGANRIRRKSYVCLAVIGVLFVLFSLNLVRRAQPDSAHFSEKAAGSLQPSDQNLNRSRGRVLHVVSSLSEYDKGTRGTQKGWDRLFGRTLPTLLAAIQSQGQQGFQLDVVLVLGFTLREPRRSEFIDAVHRGSYVRGQAIARVTRIWDDAIPREEYAIAYAKSQGITVEKYKESKAWLRGESINSKLARQHRLVVAENLDKLDENASPRMVRAMETGASPMRFMYDVFSCWEDDMYLSGPSLSWFVELSEKLESLAKQPKHVLDSLAEPLESKRLTSAKVLKMVTHSPTHIRDNSTSISLVA